jgi:sugar phosphate isomerase/epimerase
MKRRSFLSGIVSSSAALAAKQVTFDRPLGVQLYTVRNTLPHDPEGVIEKIAKIGYKEAEVSQPDIEKVVPILKQNGMTAPSGHYDLALVEGKRKDLTWGAAIEQAKQYGIHYMVMSYIPEPERGNADAFRAIADHMNKAGEACAKAGLEFCYHNHAFEFAGKEGDRPWDVMMSRWDPKLVKLEVDVFWVSVSGQTPSEFLRKYNNRVPLVHLKDKAFGTPVQFNEHVPPYAFREVGTGTLDFPAILRACEAVGVQHYIVEQDQTKGDPIESLRISYSDIRKMNLKKL